MNNALARSLHVLLLSALALGVVMPGSVVVRAEAQGPLASPPNTPRQRTQGPQGDPELLLVGIVVRDGGEARAVIEDRRTGRQGLYRVGALVRGGRLTKILEDRVTLAFSDGEVELRLAGIPGQEPSPMPAAPSRRGDVSGPGTPPASGTQTFEVPARFRRLERSVVEHLAQRPDVLSDVAPVPSGGVRVTTVRSGGLLETLGLRSGDVILNVNGRSIDQGLALSAAIEQAAGEQLLRIEVERGGRRGATYFAVQP